MGQRTINKGTRQLALTNLTANRIVVLNGAVPKSGSVNVPLEDYVNRPDAAEDLAGHVDAGNLTVSLNGVALSSADLRSLRTVETQAFWSGMPQFANVTRPDPLTVPEGYTIFNTDDAGLNIAISVGASPRAWQDVALAAPT